MKYIPVKPYVSAIYRGPISVLIVGARLVQAAFISISNSKKKAYLEDREKLFAVQAVLYVSFCFQREQQKSW